MKEIDEIHSLLTMLETRIEKLEKTFESRLIHLDNRIQIKLKQELIKLEIPLFLKIKLLLLKIKQLFCLKPPV